MAPADAPSPPPAPPEAAASDAPDRLTRDDVLAGLRPTEPGVRACPVTAATILKLRITIAPNGTVTSAVADGEHAGTPLERCAAAVVKKAHFRTFGGAPLTVVYPYRLAP